MESEETALPEALEVSDETDTIETSNELTVLKPIAYEISSAPATKSGLVDTNAPTTDEDQRPDAAESPLPTLRIEISDEEDSLDPIKKANNPKYCSESSELSPNTKPGKSRYGRVRKQKLSTDFVSVDRKAFAVLNSSSYETARIEDTPRKVPLHKKNKRSYRRRSNILWLRNETAEEKVDEKKAENFSPHKDQKIESYLGASGVQSSPLISSLNSGTIKTYSRKNEGNIFLDENTTGTNEIASSVNYTELNWKIGDIAWAKVGCYPYWPSIVTLEYGSSIYVKPVGKRGNRLRVHVQFFGDRGRRSWVLTTSLIKYESKDQFMELKRIYKKDKIRYKYFTILRQQDLWEKAISEADTILKLPNEERIQYYQNIYPVSEETYIAEMVNMNKVKRPVVRRRRNPEERRGRKRKIFSINQNLPIRKRKRISDLSTIDSSINAVIAASASENGLVSSSKTNQKANIDEHLRRRRAFERRLNKIVKQSSVVSKKRSVRNGARLQRLKNAKFNKLLMSGKNDRNGKPSNASGSGTSSLETKEKDSKLSVYDFESDEETDVFISYNSRFTPNLMAKIDTADKMSPAKESEKAKSSSEDEKSQLTKIGSVEFDLVAENNPNEMDVGKTKDSDMFESAVTSEERLKSAKNFKPKVNEIRTKKSSKAESVTCSEENEVASGLDTSSVTVEKRMLNDSDKKYDDPKKRRIERFKKSKKINSYSDSRTSVEPVELKESEPPKISRKVLVDIPFDDLDSDEDESKSNDTEEDLKSDEKRRSSVKKNSNIFAGLKTEKVCLICEKPGDTVRCRGPCSGTYHVSCVQKADADEMAKEVVQKRSRVGRPRKSRTILVSPTESGNVTTSSSIDSQKKTEVDRANEENGSARLDNNLAQNEKSEIEVNALEIKTNSVVINVTVEKVSLETDKNETEIQDQVENESKINKNVESALSNGQEIIRENNVLPEVVSETYIDEENVTPENKTTCNMKAEIESENNQTSEKENKGMELLIKADEATSHEKPELTLNTEDKEAKSQSTTENLEESYDENTEYSNSGNVKTSEDVSSVNSLLGKTDNSNGNGIEFRCNKCTNNILYPCFTCGKEVQEKTGEAERYSCYLASCGRVYHKECLKAWPQATWTGNNSYKIVRNGSSITTARETLMCPQHYCHTCISDNINVEKNKHNNEILVRCIRCPTAYHKRVHCIPAGTEILTMSQIICPRHYEPPPGLKHAHFNTSWCFICCMGGSLICCDECPTSFHAECLQLKPEEYEGRYICEDCQIGRYLLYGEVAWVKLGHYRWWPAQILYPKQIPENILSKSHRRGEFAVEFYGSHNYNWVSRGRAFLYQEGDSGKKTCRRSSVDLSFEKAVQEAEEAYQKLKIDKAAREEEARAGLKPPRYVRIKTNKPVGNVRIVELNTSNITACECDPKSERPCAPESDCLNRMLLVECNPLVCPAGDRCHNQAFEKRIYPPLMPYKTDKKGWGLKTLVDMKKGDFIIEYVGEMIDEEEYKRRVNTMHKNQENNYYFLTIDNHRMLDAGPKGNLSRFMNHSCDPNCETQKWTVNGDTRVGLFALKDIPANTELVFNYNLVTQGNEMKPCFCGAENCSGFIGVKAFKNGNSTNEEEYRKKSNEDNKKTTFNEKRRKRVCRKKRNIRRRNLLKKIQPVETEKKSVNTSANINVPSKSENGSEIQKNEEAVKRLRTDSRFKRKTSYSTKVEALRKHRDALKRRVVEKRAIKSKERKIETRGRKKIPRTEQEKQEMLFQMIKKRIERKYEEMSTLCSLDNVCFVCGNNSGELLFCDNNKCPKGYHLDCLNKDKWPSGRWLCPWHYCNICKSIKKVHKCTLCINSYCFLHVENHIFVNEKEHYVCRKHRDNNHENKEISKKVLDIELEDVNKVMEIEQSGNSKLIQNSIDNDSSSASTSTIMKQKKKSTKLSQNNKTAKKIRGRVRSKPINKKKNVQDHRLVTKKPLKKLCSGKMGAPYRQKLLTTNNLGSKVKIKKKIKTQESKNVAINPAVQKDQIYHKTQKRYPLSSPGNNATCMKTSVKKSVTNSKSANETYKETEFYVNNNGLDDEFINLEVEVINDGDSN